MTRQLVLEPVTRNLRGIKKIGAHISEEKARIDFAWPDNIAQHFAFLTAETEKLVRADLAVECGFSDEAAGLRYWKIDGFAQAPCGGTHIRRSGEVGRSALKQRNIGEGKEQIEIALVDS